MKDINEKKWWEHFKGKNEIEKNIEENAGTFTGFMNDANFAYVCNQKANFLPLVLSGNLNFNDDKTSVAIHTYIARVSTDAMHPHLLETIELLDYDIVCINNLIIKATDNSFNHSAVYAFFCRYFGSHVHDITLVCDRTRRWMCIAQMTCKVTLLRLLLDCWYDIHPSNILTSCIHPMTRNDRPALVAYVIDKLGFADEVVAKLTVTKQPMFASPSSLYDDGGGGGGGNGHKNDPSLLNWLQPPNHCDRGVTIIHIHCDVLMYQKHLHTFLLPDANLKPSILNQFELLQNSMHEYGEKEKNTVYMYLVSLMEPFCAMPETIPDRFCFLAIHENIDRFARHPFTRVYNWKAPKRVFIRTVTDNSFGTRRVICPKETLPDGSRKTHMVELDAYPRSPLYTTPIKHTRMFERFP